MDSIPDPTSSDTESTTRYATINQYPSKPNHTTDTNTEYANSIPSPQPHRRHPKEQTTFPLAHPPPKPTQRLRLTPKLLLQIQHLSPKSTRPLPVLEVWLPSRFAGRLCANANLPKLRAGDMYITQSEAYTSLSGDSHSHSHNLAAESEATGSQEAVAVVGVIYHAHAHAQKPRAKSKEDEAQAAVHFPLGGRTWTASATAGGGYRFQTREGQHVLEWKRRGTSTDAAQGADSARFVLGIVDVRTRRGARVALLTKRGFEVGCWERLPREGLQECVVASSMEVGAGAELSEAQLRTAVYTMILTMGVWVASQEGWLGG